jgi:hypothetical protein
MSLPLTELKPVRDTDAENLSSLVEAHRSLAFPRPCVDERLYDVLFELVEYAPAVFGYALRVLDGEKVELQPDFREDFPDRIRALMAHADPADLDSFEEALAYALNVDAILDALVKAQRT